METYVIKNLLKVLKDEVNREKGYKVAYEFNRDEITMKNVPYDTLKQKAFEMACLLVHIKYELHKNVEALEIIENAERYIEISK